MNEKKNKSPEKLSNSQNSIEKKISNITYKTLKKYTEKKNIINELMTFKTSKWLEAFKKEIQKLKDSGELKKNIDIKKLFYDLENLKEKIKKLASNERNVLKNQLEINNKEFTPNKKYDLAEQIKQKNPKLYQVIVSPKWLKQNIISAWFWVWNSLYKTWVWLGKLSIDLFKLLTFQVSLNDIKEQFKRV